MNLRHHGNRSEGYIAVPVDGIDKRVTASVVFVHLCTTAALQLTVFAKFRHIFGPPKFRSSRFRASYICLVRYAVCRVKEAAQGYSVSLHKAPCGCLFIVKVFILSLHMTSYICLVRYFMCHGGEIDGVVEDSRHRRSPIPSGGLEIKLRLTWSWRHRV